MEGFQEFLKNFKNLLWGNWLVYVLIALAILYTITTGFIQFRHFGYIMKKTLIKAFKERNNEREEGSLSTFKAMMVTLAGNIGGGNVVGVSSAILSGGFGAIFWMWFAAIFGMALKYGEIVLSQLYRGRDKEGKILSGPMYYIRDGLKMKWLGIVIAILMTFKMMAANLVQSNTIANIIKNNFNINVTITGIVLVILLFLITIGGLKRLANVATSLVPIMSILYVFLCIIVLLVNITTIPAIIKAIFTQAFSAKAAFGGLTGIAIKQAMQYGIARGMYSNEAGEGTAPFAHGSAIVDHPVLEGITGVTEVFVDTIVVCSMTALTVGASGISLDGSVDPTNMAITAIGSVFGPLKYIAIFALLIFCFTTLMGQWFNAAKSFNYAYGVKFTSFIKYVYPLLCLVGCLKEIDVVWTIGDIAMGLVVIPNMIALLFLFPQVREQTKDFFNNYLPNHKEHM